MKNLFYFLFLFFSISKSFSQDTIYLKNENDTLSTIKEKALFYKVIDKSASPVEIDLYHSNGVKVSKFHVDSVSRKVYEGEYESYFYNGRINVKGIFKNDKMQGAWIVYNKDKDFIEKKVNYKDDLKDGRSYTFYENGKLKRMDIFIKDTSVLSTCYDSSGNTMVCDKIDYSETFGRAEIMPSFPGGIPALFSFLQRNIMYPKEARENGLVGKVIVRFYIDVDGSVQDPVVLKDGVGGGCAQEALRVCKLMPKWMPGSQRGKLVKVYYTLPVTFNIVK